MRWLSKLPMSSRASTSVPLAYHQSLSGVYESIGFLVHEAMALCFVWGVSNVLEITEHPLQRLLMRAMVDLL